MANAIDEYVISTLARNVRHLADQPSILSRTVTPMPSTMYGRPVIYDEYGNTNNNGDNTMAEELNYFKDYLEDNYLPDVNEYDATVGQLAQDMIDTGNVHDNGRIILEAIIQHTPDLTMGALRDLRNVGTLQDLYRQSSDENIGPHEFVWEMFKSMLDSYSFAHGFGTYDVFANNMDEYSGHIREHLLLPAEIPVQLVRLPPHWECPVHFRSELTDDQHAEFIEMINDAYRETPIADRMDPFIAYTSWRQLISPEGADEQVAAVEQSTHTTLDQTIAERVLALEGRELVTARQASPNTITLPNSSMSQRATNNGPSVLSSIGNQMDTLRRSYAEYISNVITDTRNREINKVNSKYSEVMKEFSDRLNVASFMEFERQLAAINADDSNKWYIVQNPHTTGKSWLAVTKKMVTITGSDSEERGHTYSDETFCYGHLVVEFNKLTVKNVYLGGLANVLNKLDIPIHPHKDDQGGAGFCWGNIAGAVIEAVSGNETTFSGSQRTAAANAGNLQLVAEAALKGVKDDALVATTLSQLERHFRIADIKQYLQLVYQILAFADYENPYLFLGGDRLDDLAMEAVQDMGDDRRYDVFGSGEYESGCFSTIVDDMDMSSHYLPNVYRTGIKKLYEAGKGDKEELIFMLNKHHNLGHFHGAEKSWYDSKILAAGEETAEVPTATPLDEAVEAITATATGDVIAEIASNIRDQYIYSTSDVSTVDIGN